MLLLTIVRVILPKEKDRFFDSQGDSSDYFTAERGHFERFELLLAHLNESDDSMEILRVHVSLDYFIDKINRS